jgi:hypothetical protein
VDNEVFLVSYTFGKIIAFLMLRKPIGYLLWVVFCDYFLKFFIYVGKRMDYKKVIGNALKDHLNKILLLFPKLKKHQMSQKLYHISREATMVPLTLF